MSTPHTCPVCKGCGIMPPEQRWLYELEGAKLEDDEPCRPCLGIGIVWEPEGPVRTGATSTDPPPTTIPPCDVNA